MSEIDKATKRLNDAADKATITTDFFDELTTAGNQSDVINPNNNKKVPSVSKQVMQVYEEEGLNPDAISRQNQQLIRSLGEWQSGLTFEKKGDYATFNDQAIITNDDTPLPYTTQGSDPTNGPDEGLVIPFADVTRSDLVTVREDLLGLGSQLYMGDDGDTVKVGDTVPVGTTHLRIELDGSPTLFAMFPALSGEVSEVGSYYVVVGGSTSTLYTKSGNSIKLSALCPPKGAEIDQGEDIQSAFEFCAENNIELIVDAEYWVSARPLPMDNEEFTKNTGIYVPSGSRSRFIGEGCLKLIPNDHSLSYVVNFYLKDNIKMVDPVVYGDKDEHLGTSGEYGHCYNITSCSNVTLENPKAFNAWGDGYYVGLEYWTTQAKHLENVKILGAEFDNCSRNGISFCSGKNVKIELLRGHLVNRVDPRAGVDIEPEVGASSPITPTYENCVLDLNLEGGMTSGLLFFLSKPDMLDNCDITINKLHTNISGVCLQLDKKAVTDINGLINILDFTSTGTRTYPMLVRWALDDLNVHCHKTTLKNSNNAGEIASPQSYSVVIPDITDVEGGGFFFDEIRRINETRTPKLARVLGNISRYSLNFISDTKIRESTALGVSNSPIKGELTWNYYLVNSRNLAATDINIVTRDYSGVTVTLSPNVRFKQTYSKNSTTYPLKFEPAGDSTLTFDGSQYSAVKSNSRNARCEIIDDGDGNKTLVPLIGSWTGS